MVYLSNISSLTHPQKEQVMPRRDDIQKLLLLYTRRLQKLREQEALKGISTPPEILIEIEDLEDKLAGLQAELESASSQPVSPLTDDDLAQELTRLSGHQPTPSSSAQMGGLNLSNISGSTITIGNVSANVSAGGDIVGGDKTTITTSTGGDTAQAQLEAALAQWRQTLQTIINRLDDEDDRDFAEKTANKIVIEAQKGEAADPKKVESFLDKISNRAPDILEVTATTLQNPFKGVGLVLEKINDRIKLEREKH
jgi:hypothetical protein